MKGRRKIKEMEEMTCSLFLYGDNLETIWTIWREFGDILETILYGDNFIKKIVY